MSDFAPVFAALKAVLAKHDGRLAVKTDTAVLFTVVGRSPSPFAQHKGHPLEFGSVKSGKAYVSYHLMPLYTAAQMSPALHKRMQGKSCFNFTSVPEAEVLSELDRLTAACLRNWAEKGWV